MGSSRAGAEQQGESRYRGNDWRLLLRLWPYARSHWLWLLLSVVLLLPLALLEALQPLVLKAALDGPIAKAQAAGQLAPYWPELQGIALILLGLLVGRTLLQFLEGYSSQKLGQRMTGDIREDLFAHILALPARFFDQTPVGKLITRITSDVEALGDVFSTGTIGIVSDLFTLFVTGIIMVWQRWDLGLLLIALVIPMAVLVNWLQQKFRDANYRVREELSKLNSLLQENIIGISVVQMFRREAHNAQEFRHTNQRYIQEVDTTIFYDAALSAILEWVSWLAVALLLWVGGRQILDPQGSLTFGGLYAFILFSQRFFNPLRQLAEKFTSLQSGFTAVERISNILDLPIVIRDPEQPKILPPQGGTVTFEQVWFGYKPDEPVLKNLSFTIQAGEKVAIVGPTGAGKSSIIRLLCRLYDVSSGRILIDGVDIRDLSQKDLRQRVGVILQDGFLFSGSVLDNITLDKPGSREEVRRVTQSLNLDSFIMDLPQDYATSVRERGSNLSSGQKQLISFARVMWRDPQILVLDEATASLDVGTEAQIQVALQTLLVNRTAIIIAHRLSTIRDVDRILVLQRGELKEQGSHEELMAVNGLYANLYRLQALQATGKV
ncbi:MAG: ABC transporter ATP-binding protein [Thermostichales cyanobacterium BF4_bins_65]